LIYQAQKYYIPSEYATKTPYSVQSAPEQGSMPMRDFVLLFPLKRDVNIKMEKLAIIAPTLSPGKWFFSSFWISINDQL